MGADGHIAIYDWEKVKAYLESRTDKYIPAYAYKEFPVAEVDSAFAFADEVAKRDGKPCVWGCYRGGGSAAPVTRTSNLSNYVMIKIGYESEQMRPAPWPGYICEWTCDGRPACLVYWGDNIDADPFEDYEWLGEWANENALLVADQEVWT